MTELEERLLAEVTKLEDGMSDLAEQLQAINERFDTSTKLIETLSSDLENFSEKQQALSSILEKLQNHFSK